MVFWLLKYIFVGPILRIMGRPKVFGIENIPAEGPAIIVGNHLSVMDSFFQTLYAPRPIAYLAKSEYFTGKGIKGRLKRWFFLSVGQVPIDRSSGDAAQTAIDAAVHALDENRLLGIYPEGTRSPDGRLYKGKTGIARIVTERDVPVIPIAMIDSEKFNPPGKLLPRYHRVTMIVGKPIDLSHFTDGAGDPFMARAIVDKIMHTIMDLSGQDYVDMYAADVK